MAIRSDFISPQISLKSFFHLSIILANRTLQSSLLRMYHPMIALIPKHAQFITTTVILVRPETKKELRAGGEEVHYRTLNTGALTILAFRLNEQNTDCSEVDIWVCVNPDEEDIIESAIGEIIPGTRISGPAGQILGGLSLQQNPAIINMLFLKTGRSVFLLETKLFNMLLAIMLKTPRIQMSN